MVAETQVSGDPTRAGDPGPTLADPQAAPARLERGTVLGRYVVLDRIGAGGMGVVHAAWDPELDRKVALKLLHGVAPGAGDQDGRERLLREAQALARLAHPNVVAIHDVGDHAGRVWLAMEFVEGRTFRAWRAETAPRWGEVLQVMLAAGQGVAAAHAAGLVHRDLKPDNIMVGDDDRVRVMDFGLASAAEGGEPGPGGPAGSVAGTPAYMAPEQHCGLPVGPAADQFAWCVTTWEGLYGERPFAGDSPAAVALAITGGELRSPSRGAGVPGWLRRALLRGMATDPERRWSDLSTLIDHLSRGRSRARRRWIFAGLAAVGVALGLGEGARRLDRARGIEACELAAAAIVEVWNERTKERVAAAIRATGVSHADHTARQIGPWLDAQAHAWREASRLACLEARVERTWDAAIFERATWCLDERRLELAALVEQLVEADARVAHRAIPAAAGLARVEPCGRAELLAWLPAPPSGDREPIGRVRTLLSRAAGRSHAGRYSEALEDATAALAAATEIGWPPLTAAARARVGGLLDRTGAHEQARTTQVEAYFEAVRADARETAASVATDLVYTAGYRLARHEEALVWGQLAQVELERWTEEDDPRRADLWDRLGLVHNARGAYAEALALHERALEIRERTFGSHHPSVAVALNNMAVVERNRGEPARAERLHVRALDLKERAFGPDHPLVASSLTNLGTLLDDRGEPQRAAELHRRALAIHERTSGPETADAAGATSNLARSIRATGDLDEAERLYQRALEIDEKTVGPDHPNVASSLNNVATVLAARGDHAPARALYERALAIREHALGPDHPEVAMVLSNLGDLYRRSKDPAGGRSLHERALAIRERAFGPDDPRLSFPLLGLGLCDLEVGRAAEALVPLERALRLRGGSEIAPRDLAEARFALARGLWDAPEGRGRDRARALGLAREAIAVYRSDPALTGERPEIEAWLAQRADATDPE